MAKRGYKLQEFVAHTENVNCLSIGKKACRLLLTGGDDNKVNVWAIGKPTSLMSLCGHTSTVESVAFDSEEVLVLAGSSSGVLKLWDLEESKMVRGLTAHRSNCTAVDFHPFGEFFASGSMDTNLKIWDIRKKGCVHTYKGHTRGISTTRFTPDGRWVVSGGFDNVVKVWDLTAGKLLHDLKFHEGHISSIDFHPLEFLLATGSADRTVKFWDLETFELIGSTRPEATGVRSISFHPDGRTLFSGSDDALKVYSWEPIVCHDSVDMGWSTLGDLCIHEGKLLGCSYFENSVGVWVADTTLVKPYRDDIVPEHNDCVEKKCNLNGSHSSEKKGIGLRSNFGLRSLSPDDEMKYIKNIYVDTSAGNPVSSQRVDSINSSKLIPPLDPYEVSDLLAEKQSPVIEIQTVEKSVVVPKHSQSGRESITFSKTKPGMLLRPAHAKKPSKTKFDFEKLSAVSESDTLSKTKGKFDSEGHLSSETRTIAEDKAINSCEEKCSDIKCDAEKFEKASSPQTTPNKETGNDNHVSHKDTTSVKIVNGVAVVSGRTRTLVERFEKREILKSSQSETTVAAPQVICETDRTITEMKAESQPVSSSDQNISESCLPGKESTSPVDMTILGNQITITKSSSVCDMKVTLPNDEPSTPDINENAINSHQEGYLPESFVPGRYFTSPVDRTILGHQTTGTESSFADDRKVTVPDDEQLTPDGNQNIIDCRPSSRDSFSIDGRTSIGSQSTRKESNLTYDRKVTVTDTQSARRETTSARDEMMSRSQKGRRGTSFANGRKVAAPEIQVSRRESTSLSSGTGMGSTFINDKKATVSERQSSRRELSSPGDRIMPRSQISRPRSANDRKITAEIQISRRVIIPPSDESALGSQVSKTGSISATNRKVIPSENHISRREVASNMDEDVKMESVSADERDVSEKLLETHDVFVSTLRSRLTKLQVVRHFWVKSDTKSAISALQKLPDHSVQADVISVLMENTESFTLDFFSYLLPVLLSLLDSQMERHACVSLEMLLKLVAVFGPVINSTVSAPRAVGVDLHAEQRREWCNQCFKQLQKIQKLLPAIIRRGGALARNAEELNLVLQQS